MSLTLSIYKKVYAKIVGKIAYFLLQRKHVDIYKKVHFFSDRGDRIGDNNLCQRGAASESPLPNGGDRIGDNIGGICFSFGIGMEQSSILGEEDSLYRLIRGIILTYLNLRQRVAAGESIVSDGGDRIGDDNLRQRGAVFESPVSDGGDGIGGSIHGNGGGNCHGAGEVVVRTIGHGGCAVFFIRFIGQRIDRDRGGLNSS